MKKIAMVILLAGAMVAAAPNIYAKEAKDLQGIYEECGIGGLLFPRWPIGASVSNFTWDWGLTASTSGLTTPEACKGGQAKLAAYIYKSYDSIEKDLAKGDGKYLDMLAVLSEKTTEEKDMFIQDMRTKFREVVERDDYSSLSRLEKAKLVFAMVNDLADNS
ncbi:MAG: hypothetical protein A3D10_01680 [Omnitrophica WOR_2 bacterium RIFCSPHIGHO2_02_FULL_48_11]|nr:MAG: hypothetical protein A3D10_01680 [Omnitrophica WOR_2 bacterium RIFCSPHIGHO2_02_FULL_48_11]